MFLFLALALAAHAGDPAPASTPAATPLPAPNPPAKPACVLEGNWAGTLPPGPQPWNGQSIKGRFGDGLFTSETPMGHRSVSYSVDHDTVTFTHSTTTGHGACASTDTGHYTLAFGTDCQTLTLTVLDDTCVGRTHGFAGVTWHRD